MFCTECGKELPSDSQFCTNCGAQLSKPAQPPAQPGGTAPQTAPSPPPQAASTPPVVPPPVMPAGPAVPPMVGPAAPKKKKTLIWAIAGVVSLLVVAAVVIVLVFVVFAGDTGKAKDLVKKSDAYMTKVTPKGEKLGTSVGNLMNNIASVTSASDYEAMADKIREQTSSIRSDLNLANQGHKQILDLNGVDKYKEYARAVIALIDADLEQIKEVDDYLDYLSSQFKAAETGQTVSEQEVAATTAAFITKLKELTPKINELKDKAESLRKDL